MVRRRFFSAVSNHELRGHPRATASPLSRETPRKSAAPQDEAFSEARPAASFGRKLSINLSNTLAPASASANSITSAFLELLSPSISRLDFQVWNLSA
jgi:hypothetical protein